MARSRLPLELFQRLLEQVCDRLRGCVDTAAGWHGHRVWMMDGSSCSMQRWQIETNLRHLKQTLHMDVLRTKSVDGIHKELAMFTIVYNLVRLVMLEAAQRQGVITDRNDFAACPVGQRLQWIDVV